MNNSIVPNSSVDLVISELSGSKIRRTTDGRFSVYDLIRIAGGKKNPRDSWKNLCDNHSECVGKIDTVELGIGKAKKLTPVATVENCLYILGLLPGICGQSYRESAASEDRGTWAHPKIAIRFAQWCNVKFAIQVDFWIDELLNTGKVELAVKPQLPSQELAVETAVAIDRIQDILSKSRV